jgi:hypothetical protein
MMPTTTEERTWQWLQENAHRPEIQARIRCAIRQGTIRVRPTPAGGITILTHTIVDPPQARTLPDA